ncbi:MAG: hypothetical protein IPN18_21780 [Ignavibacteriales bacterium]|nr:hypothetical protein [Ignavibacteriales bacterium]
MTKKNLTVTSIGIVLGGVAGYAYYHFIGCTNGCPIQSNPWLTTLYGAFTGFVTTFSFKKVPPKEEN